MRFRFPRYHRGWFVWNPGAGGGGGTVQTDGVTIQGDGSAGNKIAIKAVQLAARLTGAGTVASKLDIAGWPIPFISPGISGGFPTTVTANTLILYGLTIGYALTFSKISVNLTANDNTNNSDIGLYDASGLLVANIGAQHTPSGGVQTYGTVQGAQTIPPGLYFFAVTSAGSTLQLNGNDINFAAYWNSAFGSSSGGALPASITPPAVAPSLNGVTIALS
jgi:hypothetical protein